MLKFYVKSRETVVRLRKNENGVVSFEYVIVAACVVAAVVAAFGTSAASGIGLALSTSIADISTKVVTAVTG